MNSLLLDFRYALRALRKSPGATAVAVLALALGIGVNTSCFIWVNALVLHPLPYPNLERIMALAESVPKLSAQRDLMVAPANALDWREQNHAFEQMALYRPWDANLTGAHEPERIQACLVTANFFALLGMKPALGRVFSKQEEDAAANATVIVSHGFWQRRLASNPNAVGQSISLDNRSYTIDGVMPADLDYPLATDLWAPLALSPQEKNQRDAHTVLVLGRLQPGVSVAEARATMQIIARRLETQYPQTNKGRSISVVPLRELTNEVTDRFVLLLWGTSTFVLLLACANIANLQLARATTRQRQFAVEAALGASRLRIALRVLAESTLVALLGGGVGIWLASWDLEFAKSRVPSEVLRFVAGMKTIHIDGRVAAFTVLVSLMVAILCSAPAVLLTLRRNAAGDLSETLKEGGRSSSFGRCPQPDAERPGDSRGGHGAGFAGGRRSHGGNLQPPADCQSRIQSQEPADDADRFAGEFVPCACTDLSLLRPRARGARWPLWREGDRRFRGPRHRRQTICRRPARSAPG